MRRLCDDNAATREGAAALRRGYPDLHEHLQALYAAGLLVKVDRPINKDTEMHPLVRWQFRGGIEERDRKAFESAIAVLRARPVFHIGRVSRQRIYHDKESL